MEGSNSSFSLEEKGNYVCMLSTRPYYYYDCIGVLVSAIRAYLLVLGYFRREEYRGGNIRFCWFDSGDSNQSIQ